MTERAGRSGVLTSNYYAIDNDLGLNKSKRQLLSMACEETMMGFRTHAPRKLILLISAADRTDLVFE